MPASQLLARTLIEPDIRSTRILLLVGMRASRVGGEELTPEHFFRQADPSGLGNGHTTSGLGTVTCLEGTAIDAGIGRAAGGR